MLTNNLLKKPNAKLFPEKENLPNQRTLPDFRVEGECALTRDENRVLIEFTDLGDDGRIIIFGSARALLALSICVILLMDGSFKIIHSLIMQMDSIHGVVGKG